MYMTYGQIVQTTLATCGSPISFETPETTETPLSMDNSKCTLETR